MRPAERWSHVSDILSRALDRPETQRDAFLAEALAQQPALRTEVLALFEELRHTEGFLEAAVAPDVSEDSFGPYRVIGELGEGGMGVVHLAERSDGQFTRRVAIKRVGSVAPRPDVLRRFRDERQILARLDHANIAQLLDAGVDAAGVPYLVLEHVEGLSLTSHCRERSLSVRQRLALFLKVCAGVHHAHQNLVIHRDLKPGNILVTRAGEPKLLDFGIAAVLSDVATGDPTLTLNRALTLDFASPEQVRGEPVTTATDVYSLGIVLYELLADRKAYEVGAHSLSEAVRLVCESAPVKPSLVAPPARRGELSGDLDAIVARATEKAASDRYGSVAELAADVEAHLDHLPVKARRHSFAYLARKLVRRHRAGAAVAAAGVVLLATGVGAVLWQARVAERERARAQQRFDQVRQLANFVIFDLQDGVAKLTGSTELRRQMVERSLAYLDSLAGEAAEDANLQVELAGAYTRLADVLGREQSSNLGDREGALKSYRQARTLLEQVLGRDARNADARRSLARLLISIHAALDSGSQEQRTRTLAEGMALWEGLFREDPTHEPNLRGLASAHFATFNQLHTFRNDDAVPHMERALELFERLLAAKPDDQDRKRNVGLCHKYLSGHFHRRDVSRAVRHSREAVRMDSERVKATPHSAQAKIDYTFSLSTLGDLRLVEGNKAEALQLFQQALAIRRHLWEADRADVYARDRLAYMLMRVAEMHVLAGRHRTAGPLLEASLAHVRALPVQAKATIFTVTKVYLLLGEVARAQGRDPCLSYRRMAERLRQIPDADEAGHFVAGSEKLRDRALLRLKTCFS